MNEFEDSDIIINKLDGLYFNEIENLENEDNFPKSLIITGVPEAVFDNESIRDEFEELFVSEEGVRASFEYLKSFMRARVSFESTSHASQTRLLLHGFHFLNSKLNCFLAQPPDSCTSTCSNAYLELPRPYKQFLISPPSSPPSGWEACLEKQPSINLELISAINNLTPGESHEVIAASPSSPGITVHACQHTKK